MKLRLSGLAIASCATLLAACGGGGGSSGPPPPPPPTTVAISGTVTFDKVPPNADNIGLSYAAVAPAPARGVRVEAVRVADGTVATSVMTDSSGAYSFSVPANTNLFIRVKAEMQLNGGPSWHYRVLDNTVTPTPALYAIDGDKFDSGVTSSTRDLNAASGWDISGNTGYTGKRSAASFAVLDAVYQATQLVLTANPNAAFPDLDLFWSKDNREVSPPDENISLGNILTTYFDPASRFPAGTNPHPAIFILGVENLDTDEYDPSVIAHEWGHYFQYAFSRDDSGGGRHAQTDELDLRVAFSEGWGNAFSGMATRSSVYRDSSGLQQGNGGCLNLDGTPLGRCNSPVNLGWYNEGSVQSLLFNFFDTANSGVDQISLGFVPIFNVMANDMRTTRALTSIFPFVKALKTENAAEATHIDQLLQAQQISTTSIDEWGGGEAHDGSVPSVLPIYQPIVIGQPAVTVCSMMTRGTENKLGNFGFLRLTVSQVADATIHVNGASTTDPDIVLYDGGKIATVANGTVGGSESLVAKQLAARDYVIEVYDSHNVDPPIAPANSCFSVNVTSP